MYNYLHNKLTINITKSGKRGVIMELKKAFEEFLTNIRLTPSQNDDLIKGHSILRERLESYTEFPDNIEILNTFLQGSYKRGTAVKPNGNKRVMLILLLLQILMKQNILQTELFQLLYPF